MTTSEYPLLHVSFIFLKKKFGGGGGGGGGEADHLQKSFSDTWYRTTDSSMLADFYSQTFACKPHTEVLPYGIIIVLLGLTFSGCTYPSYVRTYLHT